MTLKPLTERDLIVLVLILMTATAISTVDTILEITDPTRGFLDFAILFSYGWGLYWLGKLPPS